MIVHNGMLPNPAPTLLEDLVSRIGSPGPESLSPYDGMRSIFQEQHLSNYSEELLRTLLNDCPDYNPKAQYPIAGPYVSKEAKPANGPFLTRLEDIDVSWVKQYLRDVIIGLKKRNVGGLREYNYKNQEVYSFRSNDGEGYVSPADQLIEYRTYAPTTVAEASAKLPYLLKRLQDKSKMLRVSVMSLIIAYEKVKRTRPSPEPRFILANGVYQLDDKGNLFDHTMPTSANSGRVFPAARSWIMGYERDCYFYDAMELLQVCKVLGIDITEEDPTVFTQEFIDKLKVTYIAKNRNYLKGQIHVNSSVLSSLSTVQVNPIMPARPSLPTRDEVVEDTMQLVLDELHGAPRVLEAEPVPDEIFDRFFKAYGAYRGTAPLSYDSFFTRDGFLYREAQPNTPYQVLVKDVLKAPLPPTGMKTVTAILHSAGYAFFIGLEAQVVFVPVSTLALYFEELNQGNLLDRFGEWAVC